MHAGVRLSLRNFPTVSTLHLTLACRCFCKDCLDFLVGPGTFERLKEVEPWSCYMCLRSQKHGVLKLRVDWSIRVQEFFANNSALQFVSKTFTPMSSMSHFLIMVTLQFALSLACCGLSSMYVLLLCDKGCIWIFISLNR